MSVAAAENMDMDIPELNAPHVRVKDPVGLAAKLRILKEGGKDSLHVVADFDCTLTKQRLDNGGKLLTSFGMFCECPSIPEEYKREDRRLCVIYKPIEVDPDLTQEEKAKHMVEWYTRANGLLKDFKYPKEEMEAVAAGVAANLRDGVDKMFAKLLRDKIPALVFSAGLGDAVEAVLSSARIYTPNVKVISNFLNLDAEGRVAGMRGKIIHTFNKNEAAVRDSDYYQMVKERTNVILLGDTLGDARMAEGMDHHLAAVKIGYLFHNLEGNLPLYMDAFDIVLVDDQTADVVNAILNAVT